MKSKNVFWGIILISIGLLFVLRNFGYIHFGWYSLRQLWPVILVLLGISLLPINGTVRVVLAFVVVGFSIWFLAGKDSQQYGGNNWRDFFRHDHRQGLYHDPDAQNEVMEDFDQSLTQGYQAGIRNAVLDLDAMAGEFIIEGLSDDLLNFEREGNFGSYNLNSNSAEGVVVLKLTMKQRIRRMDNFHNKAKISLHPDPLWDFKIDAGAAKIDFDLTLFKVDNVDIDGGASQINLKLGNRHSLSRLSIDAGATDVTIRVPISSGCQVKTDSFLSNKSLDGFEKNEKGIYLTENFDTAAERIEISIDAAVSNLKIIRY
ncbi:MAG TPA: DUF5668 domain-containing protein [Bacteroidales bacterium]|nr:DUF5668 domain-containing protein [Bacteroidales bacterium]